MKRIIILGIICIGRFCMDIDGERPENFGRTISKMNHHLEDNPDMKWEHHFKYVKRRIGEKKADRYLMEMLIKGKVKED